MKMFKVCHVTSVHRSGDGRILLKECSSLAKNPNYKVYLVAQGDSYVKNNVRVIGVGTPPESRVKRMFEFSRTVVKKALAVNADIYHLHDPELLQFVGTFVKKGKKVIFDSHEDVADSILDKEYLPMAARSFVRSGYKIVENTILKKCCCVISTTPHYVKKISRYNPNARMITNYPILNELDQELYKDCVRNRKSIIFAGGLQEQWMHEHIINTIAKLDGVTYELYGTADEGYLEKLKALDGWEKVNYHGQVPFDEVQKALHEAGIGIALMMPNHKTGGMLGTIGNTKLFETMNAGLPIICTDFKLWKNIVEGNNTGICIPYNDEQALTDAINKLINDPELCDEMGANGKRVVEQKYNWATQEKKLLSIYKSILGE